MGRGAGAKLPASGILGAVTAGAMGRRVRNLTIWQAVTYASELGLAFAATVVLGTFLGYLADGWLRTGAPFLTVAGALIGLGAGAYSTVRLAQAFTRPRKE